MFKYFFNKNNIIILPYKVLLDDDHIIIEAYGEYLESFVVFHGVISSKNIDINEIYVNLNELVEKNIELEVDYKDYHIFKFNFKNILDEVYINDINVSEYKVLSEVSI